MIEVTYGRLDEVLRGLGFSVRLVEREVKARVYEHPRTGAIIALPVFPDGEKVLSRHLAAARGTLDAYGISDPLNFDAELLKAG